MHCKFTLNTDLLVIVMPIKFDVNRMHIMDGKVDKKAVFKHFGIDDYLL
jgi:hypothetical protein